MTNSPALTAQLQEMIVQHGHEALSQLAQDHPEEFHEFAEDTFREQGYTRVTVGTAEAIAKETDKLVAILAVVNRQQGNGDFQKLMDDLENRGKTVIVEELWNKRLRKHLIEKRDYRPCKKNGNKRVIKQVAT